MLPIGRDCTRSLTSAKEIAHTAGPSGGCAADPDGTNLATLLDALSTQFAALSNLIPGGPAAVVAAVAAVLAALWLARRRATRGAARELSSALAEQRRLLDDIGSRLGEYRQGTTLEIGRLREFVIERLDATQLGINHELGQQQTSVVAHLATLRQQFHDRLAAHEQGVERQLNAGFNRTQTTYTEVVKRLALIDEAQKRITELSSSVVDLQRILEDKRSRGAFGEIQLEALVRNVLPERDFSLQHTLPNDRVADCLLRLPPPTGPIVIDAKFPLESYRRMTDGTVAAAERQQATRQFKVDIRKHVADIHARYIVPGTTSDGAMMFIPAEAVFAEIQAHHPDVVDEAQRARVWLVSPTTLWAVLNTARAVLRDAATREQVDVIQDHLVALGTEFARFEQRFDQLARHIAQAAADAQRVHTTARKIAERFGRIERVEMETAPTDTAKEPDAH